MQKESILKVHLEKKSNKKTIIKLILIVSILLLIIVLAYLIYNYLNKPVAPEMNKTGEETPVISNQTTTLPNQTSSTNITINQTQKTTYQGGGGGGSGEGSGGTTPCIPNCAGKQCGSDGCGGSCGSCNESEYCNATGQCVELVNCTSDSNCSDLTGVCGTGLCNLTSKICYINYSIGNICRSNISECDAVEYCSGSIDCPADLNKSDGSSCNNGICDKGKCISSCTNDYLCTGEGSFCDGKMIYNCSVGGDGCLDRVNGTSCGSGEICDSGECIKVNAIFVDNQLTSDCSGTYSIASRNCNGNDGDAYDTPQEAADVTNPGDIVYFRQGIYYLNGTYPLRINYKNGTENAKITFKNYNSEEVIIDATNVSGISGAYYGIYVAYSGYVVIDGLTVRNSLGNGIRIFNSNYVEILNCIIRSNGDKAIYYRDSSYAVVDNCEVYENRGAGIYIQGSPAQSDYPVVTDNLVYNQNIAKPEGADGIAFGNSVNYALIKGNIVFRSWDDGIDTCCGTMYTTIEDNTVFYNGDGPEGDGDGNGIKVSTGNAFGSGGGHVVRYNIAFANEANGFDQCKEPNYPQNWFYNNIAYNNSGHGVNAESDDGYLDEAAIVYNNILANNGNLDMKDRFSRSLNTSDYNIWSTDWMAQAPHNSIREGPHSMIADPRFNNSALVIDTNFALSWTIDEKLEYIRNQVREKFSLQAGSPAIDNGTIITDYHCSTAGSHPNENCREWYGNAPDIGAYEYSEGIGGMSASSPSQELPSKPSFSFVSQIYNWIKRFLTGNTIKEITGYFLRIKA